MRLVPSWILCCGTAEGGQQCGKKGTRLMAPEAALKSQSFIVRSCLKLLLLSVPLWKTLRKTGILLVFLWKTLKKTQFSMGFCGRR